MSSSLSSHWLLDSEVVYLNHGSFGACPKAVLAHQEMLRFRMERQPITFLFRDIEPLLDHARGALAAFLGCSADDLALLNNASTGLNAVLRSLRFEAGDELLVTDHEYNASRNVLDYVAERDQARVVVASVPFPPASPAAIVDAILARVTDRTRIALVDHVTSQTGLVFPIDEIVARLESRGVDTIVDGAHAPGMLPLDLAGIGAAYYTGNCHKWMCAPKGAAFLHVRPDRQDGIRPTSISHGANSPRTDRSRFRIEFDWTGTFDPTAVLSIPAALEFIGSLLEGGWPEVRERNHRLVIEGARAVAALSGISFCTSEELIGSMVSFQLPPARRPSVPSNRVAVLAIDPLQDVLRDRARIEVPIFYWPDASRRMLRISAALYNDISEYELLGNTLGEMLSQGY